jgi:hypothetical protein
MRFMSFDESTYKEVSIKILDLAREGHWHLLDRGLAMQLDVAKTYLWAASVIGGIAMFMVKELNPTAWSGRLLLAAIGLAGFSFLLAMLALWGRGQSHMPFLEPEDLAEKAYDTCTDLHYAYIPFVDLIKVINAANLHQIATSRIRANILRTAAPLLVLSFLALMASLAISVIDGR